MRDLDPVRRELRPVFAIDRPVAGGPQMLARSDRGESADNGRQVAAVCRAHSEHGKPVVRVVIGDPFDDSCDRFRHR